MKPQISLLHMCDALRLIVCEKSPFNFYYSEQEDSSSYEGKFSVRRCFQIQRIKPWTALQHTYYVFG
jgi:hypothetical protein